MTTTQSSALQKITTLVNKPLSITIDDDAGWEAWLFDFSTFSEEDVALFAEDNLGDAYMESEFFAQSPEGALTWSNKDFIPLGLVGPQGVLGDSWQDFAQTDRVLFLNVKDGADNNGAIHFADQCDTDIAANVLCNSIDELQGCVALKE